MYPERRRYKRFKVFLIVDIESLYNDRPYFLGLTRNVSYEGFTFESQNYDLNPGDILQFTLKHPSRDISVKVNGRLIWKNDTGFECVTGVRFINYDDSIKSRIFELISCDRDSTVLDHTEQIKHEFRFKEETDTRPSPGENIELSSEVSLSKEREGKKLEEKLRNNEKNKKPFHRKVHTMTYLLFSGLVILLTCILLLTYTDPDFRSLKTQVLRIGHGAIVRAGDFMHSLLKRDNERNQSGSRSEPVNGKPPETLIEESQL